MTVIEIPDDQAAALRRRALQEGLTLNDWLKKLAQESAADQPRKPLKSSRGILAKYGPGPSAEDIDEVRKEMWKNFAREDVDW